jgi:uncharacterized HAD superfamily protein
MNKDIKLKSITDDEGHLASPILPEDVKNYLIDIDGTITDDVPNEEPERMGVVLPYPDAKELLNKWYDEGHIITFFTSRTEAHREVTEMWLDKHGFKYHGLLMNKPRGGNYAIIDNHLFKAVHYTGSWDVIAEEMESYVHRYSSKPIV